MQNTVRPNSRRKLPSLRKHGLSAVLVLAIISFLTISWMQYVKRTTPALAPTVDVPLTKTIPTQINVQPSAPLPDLLKDDNIPQNINPTEHIDLLGPPPNTGPNISTSPRPPTNRPSSGVGPKTVLINGQPVTNSANPLIPAPIQGLSRMSPQGPVPTIAPDGRSVLSAYARPFAPTQGYSQISIVVGGLGLKSQITRRAINDLPPQITLSFAAQAPELQKWIDMARTRGHEVMIELPMEGGGPQTGDPEVEKMLSTQSQTPDNLRNLEYFLSQATGYFAITNYGGDVIINNTNSIGPILEHLKTSGLGFIYDGGNSDSTLRSAANRVHLQYRSADKYLDSQSQSPTHVMAQIRSLKGNTNVPIGMAYSYSGSIEGIQKWLANKPSTIELAPASYALKTR